jgi:hypothetical protein
MECSRVQKGSRVPEKLPTKVSELAYCERGDRQH